MPLLVLPTRLRNCRHDNWLGCRVNERKPEDFFHSRLTASPHGRRLSLYRHPKLIELATGRVLHVWTELHSGLQDGSMVCGLEGDAKPPPMAIDPAGRRFTIVNGDAVTVIEFSFLTGAL